MLIYNITDADSFINTPLDISAWRSNQATLYRSLSCICQVLRESADELANSQCVETGKPIRFCYSELERCYFQIESAQTFLQNWHPESDCGYTGEHGFMVRQYRRRIPIGNVLAITTFSSPYSSFFQKFLPSIITQNRFYFKPSPRVHKSSILLYEKIHSCFEELTDLLHCIVIPDEQVGALLTRPFDVILFTGKSETAKKIKCSIGRTKGIFETGSNALAYVDKSAKLDDLPKRLIADAFSQSGMRCIGLKNLFVHRAVAEELIQNLTAVAKTVPYGDPMDKRTIVGPITDSHALEDLMINIKELTSNGYGVLCGGGVENKNLLQPTVLRGTIDASLALKEAYGPLLCIYPVDDCTAIPEEYLQRSSINTSVYANDRETIETFISRCRDTTATVCVNYGPALRMDSLPFGGVADENEGRESLPGLVDFLCREQLTLVADNQEGT